MARRPKKRSFFKFLVGDFSQCLHIPPEFIQNFNGRSIQRCALRGPTGKWQDVELERRNNGLFLHEGWQNFVKEHHLEDGDLLIFRFDGESKFKVTIYDTTACEKDAEVAEMRSSSSVSLASKGQARVKEETVDLETEEYNDICEKKRSNAGRIGTHVTSGKRPEDDHAEATLNGSILFKSKKWFFTVTFKKYHRRCIYIPKKLAVAEGLMNKNRLMIQDPTGRSWLVHLKSRRNRSLYHLEMTSGLPKFCRANQIVPGDTLIFEFVKESAATIHIFRKGCKVVLDVPERDAEIAEMRSGSPIFPATGGQARVKEETVDLETEEYNKICEKKISNSGRSGIHITSGMRSEDDHAEATSNGSILFKSKKLYFTVTFKKYHQSGTYIPKKLAVAEGLMSKNCIMIQDPTGRSWLVKLGFRQNKSSGYVEMKAGLAECCRANHIVPGDTLIFEFVKESVAKMHIFRKVCKAVLDVPEDAEVAETRSSSGISLASEGQARVKEEIVDLETEEYNENLDKEATMSGKTDKYVSCGKRHADDQVEAPSVNGSLLFKSKNLCFTVASVKHHRSRIDIPKKLAIAQGLMSKNCITIQDPTGRSWLVELMFRPNGYSQRVEMRTGLVEIFRANQIVPGDSLIFEFVKDNIAKVHILRKGNSVVLDVPDVGN